MLSFDMLELGLGATIALLILREVFTFLKNKRNTSDIDIQKTQQKIEDMYDWYARVASDNIEEWYVLKSLEKSISRLDESIKEQVRVQQLSLDVLKEASYQLRHIDTKVSQIDRKLHEK